MKLELKKVLLIIIPVAVSIVLFSSLFANICNGLNDLNLNSAHMKSYTKTTHTSANFSKITDHNDNTPPFIKLCRSVRKITLVYAAKVSVIELSSHPLIKALYVPSKTCACEGSNESLLIITIEYLGKEAVINFTLRIEKPAWVLYPNGTRKFFEKLSYKKSLIARYVFRDRALIVDGKNLGSFFLFETPGNNITMYKVYWLKRGSKPELKNPTTTLVLPKTSVAVIDLADKTIVYRGLPHDVEAKMPFINPIYLKLAKLAGSQKLELIGYGEGYMFHALVVEKNTGIPWAFILVGAPYTTEKSKISYMDSKGKVVEVDKYPVTPISYLLGIRDTWAFFTLVDIVTSNNND